MTDSLVENIVRGATDSTGALIDTVYAKVSKIFAVFRTAERVVVQFADDEKLGSDQRLALAPINAIRGEINGLIDGWRQSGRHDNQAKAKLFDRRVADALSIALQGDVAHALDVLTGVKADLLAERTSVGRTEYILFAFLAALVLIAVVSLITSDWFAKSLTLGWGKDIYDRWTAAGFGTLGAFFSIALQIRDRSVRTDLQSRDNQVDAVLRIVIGAISAVILICLLQAQLVDFKFGGASTRMLMPPVLIVVAFAAGFVERLVGDLLSTSVLAVMKTASNPLAGGAAPASAMGQSVTPANEQNPLGKGAAGAAAAAALAAASPAAGALPVPEDDNEEGCLADVALAASELTDDVELPAAMGGVEQP